MTLLRTPLSAILTCGVLLGCSVDEVDVTGKACSPEAPCPDGLSCVAGLCRREAQTGCTPAFTVQNFKRDWSTPHSVRWSWEPKGAANDFVQYKLLLGRTDAELEAARSLAGKGENDGQGGNVWTQEDSPELGQYELRLSSGTDPVSASTTDALLPANEYRAVLQVVDGSGCTFETPTAIARTSEASTLKYALFDDQPHPHGGTRPGTATIVTDQAKAYEGDSYVSWPGWPDDGSVTNGDYENIGVWDLRTDPAQDYPLLDFSVGYLEAAIAIDGPRLASWGELRFILGTTPGNCSMCEAFGIARYVLRPGGGYQVLEIPLTAFDFGGEPLNAQSLQQRPICEVSVGRTWAINEPVRVDSVTLRW